MTLSSSTEERVILFYEKPVGCLCLDQLRCSIGVNLRSRGPI